MCCSSGTALSCHLLEHAFGSWNGISRLLNKWQEFRPPLWGENSCLTRLILWPQLLDKSNFTFNFIKAAVCCSLFRVLRLPFSKMHRVLWLYCNILGCQEVCCWCYLYLVGTEALGPRLFSLFSSGLMFTGLLKQNYWNSTLEFW